MHEFAVLHHILPTSVAQLICLQMHFNSFENMTIISPSDSSRSFISVSREDDGIDVLINAQTASILNWILLAGICQGVAVFGTFANIVNIVCFLRQGFKDSVDVSLFGKLQ